MRMKAIIPALLFVSMAWPQMQALAPGDTFAAAKLSAEDIRAIIAGVQQSAFDTPDSWEKELRVRRVDLGAGPGLVLRGTNLLCGATGNCQTWVFRSVNSRWASLFPDEAPLAESFQLGPGVTRGMKDFTIMANVSAESGSRIVYKYDGSVYRATKRQRMSTRPFR
jgi:hypothetical protein